MTAFNLVDYQLDLCSPELRIALAGSRRPLASRFIAVAMGRSSWTDVEREQIEANPQLQLFERKMRAAVRQAQTTEMKASLIIRFTLVPKPLLAVAQGESDVPVTKLVDSDGNSLEIYPAFAGHSTVQLLGNRPSGSLKLYVGETPISLSSQFDQYGYAIVLTEDIRSVLTGAAELGLESR